MPTQKASKYLPSQIILLKYPNFSEVGEKSKGKQDLAFKVGTTLNAMHCGYVNKVDSQLHIPGNALKFKALGGSL